VTLGSEKTFVISELATGCCSLHPLHRIDLRTFLEIQKSL